MTRTVDCFAVLPKQATLLLALSVMGLMSLAPAVSLGFAIPIRMEQVAEDENESVPPTAPEVDEETDDAGSDRLGATAGTWPSETPETTVGMTGRINQLVLAGSELTPKPLALEDPVVVRIASVQPHGELLRYDMEYWGMEEGTFDLRDFLVRNDGSSVGDLPPMTVRVNSVMVVENGHLTELTDTQVPWIGGYRLLVGLGLVLWVIGSIAIFTFWRKPKSVPGESFDTGSPETWADRLRPLLERSRDGDLSPSEQATTERLLVAFWRDKLALNDLSAPEALEKIKQDPEAGKLLLQLEQWLHSPTPDRHVDLPKLLEPYQTELIQGTIPKTLS